MKSYQKNLSDLKTDDLLIEPLPNLNCSGVSLISEYNLWNQAIREQFYRALDQADFKGQCRALVDAEVINQTENRAACYTALRNLDGQSVSLDGDDLFDQMSSSHQQMQRLVGFFQSDPLYLQDGGITDIVHIGIGGSALGPELCYQALADEYHQAVKIHFVAHMDTTVVDALLETLQPKKTLIFLASKSFTTEEVMVQAAVAKRWLEAAGVNPVDHCVAATANPDAAKKWGIQPDFILPFGEWVGGRFSVWSSVSFSLVLSLGFDTYLNLLKGAQAADDHFLSSQYNANIPVTMACLSAWYTDICQAQTHAIIPYAYRLRSMIAYIQQLQMESLGKSTTADGDVNQNLATPVIYGDFGTRSQHALSQFLMQAPLLTPIDLIKIAEADADGQVRINAHADAQSAVLWQGYRDKAAPYKDIQANQPHNIFVLDALTPQTLGALLAFYEHKVFVLGVLYDINVFDQWGVERGKKISAKMYDKAFV